MRSRRLKAPLVLGALVVVLLAAALAAALWWRKKPRHLKLEGVSTLAFSPDGKELLVAAPDAPLRVLSVPGLETVRTIEPTGDGARSISFTPDGRRVLVCSASRDLSLRGWPTGDLIQKLGSDCEWATMSPKGEWIAKRRGYVEIWAPKADRARPSGFTTGDPFGSLSFSRRGDLFAFAIPKKILVSESYGLKEQSRTSIPSGGASCAFSPRDDVLAVTSESEPAIFLLSGADFGSIAYLFTESAWDGPLVFSPDGSLIAVGGAGEVYSMDSKKLVSLGKRLDAKPFVVLALSDDYAAGATKKELVLWRAR